MKVSYVFAIQKVGSATISIFTSMLLGVYFTVSVSLVCYQVLAHMKLLCDTCLWYHKKDLYLDSECTH